MTNNNLIPFSKELWESGEYEVESKSQYIPVIHEITSTCIFGRIEEYQFVWDLNGICQEFGNHNLSLRKKTKKFWIPKIDIFASKEDCDRFFKGHNDYKGAIEVEI